MLVVERLVVGDARHAGVHLRSAEVLRRDLLAGGGLHQRRAAEEDRAGALDDHGLVGHRRHVGATRGRRAHHERDLGDPGGGHPGLVVEDPPEVLAIREDVRLERQERAAAVDQVDARQPVLERDLLRAQVLLDGHRVVRAALDRGVVGDDDAHRALDPADARSRSRRSAPHRRTGPFGGERAQLEEGRPGVEEVVDPLANRQLAALSMPGDGPVVAARAALAHGRGPGAQVRHELGHPLDVRAGIVARGIDARSQDRHGSEDSHAIRRNRRVRGVVSRAMNRTLARPFERPIISFRMRLRARLIRLAMLLSVLALASAARSARCSSATEPASAPAPARS